MKNYPLINILSKLNRMGFTLSSIKQSGEIQDLMDLVNFVKASK